MDGCGSITIGNNIIFYTMYIYKLYNIYTDNNI